MFIKKRTLLILVVVVISAMIGEWQYVAFRTEVHAIRKYHGLCNIVVVAAMIVEYQKIAVFALDDFSFTPDGYKVFKYGFPFPVIDCAPHLPMHMTTKQVVLRCVGNFAVLILAGVFIVQGIRRLWTSRPRERLHAICI